MDFEEFVLAVGVVRVDLDSEDGVRGGPIVLAGRSLRWALRVWLWASCSTRLRRAPGRLVDETYRRGPNTPSPRRHPFLVLHYRIKRKA
jgi:hypothetical protein